MCIPLCVPSFPPPIVFLFIHVVHMVVYLVFLSHSFPFYEHSKISSLHIPGDEYLGCLQCLGHMNKSKTIIMVLVFQ